MSFPTPTPQSHSAAEQQPALLYRAVTPSLHPTSSLSPSPPPPHPSLHQPPVTFQASLTDSLGNSSPCLVLAYIFPAAKGGVLPAIITRASYFASPFSPECLILACVRTAGRGGSADLTVLTLWKRTPPVTGRNTQRLSRPLSLSEFYSAYIILGLTPCENHSFGFRLAHRGLFDAATPDLGLPPLLIAFRQPRLPRLLC